MKDLLAKIQKVVPPGGTPQRVLYPGPLGSPTGTLYEVVVEVALVQNPPTTAGTSQQEGGPRPTSFKRAPFGNRSPQVRRKSTGSARSGRGQSPVPRTLDRSRTSDRARTPIWHRTPEPTATPSRGKGPMTHASPTSPADCQMVSPFPQPPSRAAPSRDPWTTPSSGGQDPVQHLGDDFSPLRSVRKGSTISGTPRTKGEGDSEDEIAPSPNMRKLHTRLQRALEGGGSSAANNPGSHAKERVAQKKHRSS